MRTPPLLVAVVAASFALFDAPPPASAGFSTLWTVGTPDGTPNEFGWESYASNNPPGSAVLLDDDYYLAGTYAAPIGVLAGPEPVSNLERAVTTSDPNDRIHFNLTAAQAGATARFRLTFRERGDLCERGIVKEFVGGLIADVFQIVGRPVPDPGTFNAISRELKAKIAGRGEVTREQL
jgi:hypothetical protein